MTKYKCLVIINIITLIRWPIVTFTCRRKVATLKLTLGCTLQLILPFFFTDFHINFYIYTPEISHMGKKKFQNFGELFNLFTFCLTCSAQYSALDLCYLKFCQCCGVGEHPFSDLFAVLITFNNMLRYKIRQKCFRGLLIQQILKV